MNFKKIFLGVAVFNFGLGLLAQENTNAVDFTIKSYDIPSIQEGAVIDGLLN